ncbi:hypothetical protein, conserved [Eimeria maxima]|uniref:Uncharacterized protein n=1 Tax=Eimeria maxima TaxID=5804 RepID=U6M700_EIMMA|nr:hypothetical protein, conserved [Eimeria maxima]CDJ57445.1 hypothetical protein, conserved [Eimeria maxima]
MGISDMGWIDICMGEGIPSLQTNCSPSHLQAVVSELDVVIRDVEGLKQQVHALQHPIPADNKDNNKLRGEIEKELNRCLHRCEQLNKQWEFEVSVLKEDLKSLKQEELKDLRAIVSENRSRLSCIEADVSVLRQLIPNHGVLKKSFQQSQSLLLQLKEQISSSSSSSSSSSNSSSSNANIEDINNLQITSQQHAAKIDALRRSMSAVENKERKREEEIEKIISEFAAVKKTIQHFEPTMDSSPHLLQIRESLNYLNQQIKDGQRQTEEQMAKNMERVKWELQAVHAEINQLKQQMVALAAKQVSSSSSSSSSSNSSSNSSRKKA